jgi:diaminopimelate decarboxylase
VKPPGPIPPEFAGQRGPLTIGGRAAADWVAEAGSPCFVYDPAIVAARGRGSARRCLASTCIMR